MLKTFNNYSITMTNNSDKKRMRMVLLSLLLIPELIEEASPVTFKLFFNFLNILNILNIFCFVGS